MIKGVYRKASMWQGAAEGPPRWGVRGRPTGKRRTTRMWRVVLFLLVLLPVPAHAEAEARSGMGGVRVFPVDHEVYELVAAVRGEAGLSEPWGSRRLTAGVLERLLEPVDRNVLSPAGRAAYDEARAHLDEQPLVHDALDFRFAVETEVALEAYLNLADPPEEGEPYEWWQVDYGDRSPVFSIPLEAAFGDWVYGRADAVLREERLAVSRPDLLPAGGYRTNVPVGVPPIDFHFPFRAFVAGGGENALLEVGRDQLRWGPAETTSLALSKQPDYYDFLRLELGGEVFRYTGLMVSLEPRLTSEERERHAAELDISGSDGGHDNGTVEVSGGELPDYAKTLVLHRFELAPTDRIRVAVNEGLMFGNRSPDLRMANPFLILHNLFEWRDRGLWTGAAFAGLELSVMPVRNWTVYGEFGMNQLDTAFKREAYDTDDVPDAFAALAGVRGRVPWRGGYFKPWLELVQSNPWFGVREHPRTSFHWRRRYVSNMAETQRLVTEAIGEPPDTRRLAAGLGYRVPGSWHAELTYELGARGENRIDSEYERGIDAVTMRTPTGEPEIWNRVRLSGSARPVAGLEGLTVEGALDVLHVSALDHDPEESLFDVQFVPTVSYRHRW